MSTQHYFIAGTDTDAGKTLVTCALLYKAKQAGLTTLGLKPVAAGCTQTKAGLRNLDALRLIQQSSVPLAYERINPIALLPPIAPHIAAAKSQQKLDAKTISQTLSKNIKSQLSNQAQLILVEGAGGWRVPLNYQETLADVVQKLNLPVILVVGMKLGCLNHALLTVEAIKQDGLTLAGWIANNIDPDMAEQQANVDTLTHMIQAPCLGAVPFLGVDTQSEVDWQKKVIKAANYLTIN